MTTAGLRDLKRQATASALARAAYGLAVERGLEGFTIDDVVAGAGYSRRTFANHYSCKEEAVVAVILERVREALAQEPDVPEDTPLLDWLHALARVQLDGPMLPVVNRLKALAQTHPALDPWLLEVQRSIRTEALAAVSARAGGRYSVLDLHLLVGAMYGAFAAVLDGPFTIRRSDEPEAPDSLGIDTVLEATFAYLRGGF